MESIVQNPPAQTAPLEPKQAWELAKSQLRAEMARADYETWVLPLFVISYREQVFTLGVGNAYARDWVEQRLKKRIIRLLEGLFNQPIQLRLAVDADQPAAYAAPPTSPPVSAPPAEGSPLTRNRKVMLQRAYGSERARIIQPERGMFLTQYFFEHWLPLIGHSAATIVLAARSMCYWNPMTGELRNEVETEMGELARRAAVSLRTVKDVLNQELIQQYFLRYRVRRVMTPNGVRTAGISLLVRMDDPLTPEDQQANALPEEACWYPAEYGGEEE